jgi:hypothetical protein
VLRWSRDSRWYGSNADLLKSLRRQPPDSPADCKENGQQAFQFTTSNQVNVRGWSCPAGRSRHTRCLKSPSQLALRDVSIDLRREMPLRLFPSSGDCNSKEFGAEFK